MGFKAINCGAGVVFKNCGDVNLDGAVFAGNRGPDIESDSPINISNSEFIENPTAAQLEMIRHPDYRAGMASQSKDGRRGPDAPVKSGKKYFGGWRPPM
ncbi:MAG: hypothetical protein WC563_05915 [Brevundimonas sp.]|jgi:hypothetical protein